MCRTTSRRPLPALTAACLAALVLAPGAARAKAPAPEKDWAKEGKFLGVETCRDCHLEPRGRPTDFVLLTEYTTWRTLDKHAQAYAALETARAKQMGKILGGDGPAVDVTKKEAGCLGCHSMSFTEGRQGDLFNIKDGVTCDGCHGPSEGWLQPHAYNSKTWRLKTPAEKEALGMRDVRDPVKKAELCASCHVGNVQEGKVITHAMYAAGHPPLPAFEVETFCKNLPQHWRDRKDVPFFQKPPEQSAQRVREIYRVSMAPVSQSQLTLAGSLTVLREQMRVIAERANVDAKGDRDQRWPELGRSGFDLPKDVTPAELWPDLAMSHSDCYACHHELVTPSWRQQRGYDLIFPGGKVTGIPGRVQVRRWPFALAGWGPGDVWGNGEKGGKGAADSLTEAVAAVYAACNAQPYGDPAKLRTAADGLSDWLKGPIDRLNGDRLNADELQGLLQKLCTSPATDFADYDSARQIASAFRSVYREWDPNEEKAPEIAGVLKKLEGELDIHPYIGRGKRLALLRAALAKKEGGDMLPSNEELLQDLEKVSSREYKNVLKGKDLTRFQQFLDFFQNNVQNLDLSSLLFTQEALKDINDIGNEELERSLAATNRYSPVRFREHMAELAKLVSAKKE